MCVGFRIDRQEIGLDHNGYKASITGDIDYYKVDDIIKHLQILFNG